MKDCKNIIVPELDVEECKGCYYKTKCVITNVDIPLIDILKGSSLEDILLKMSEIIEQQNQRIKILEDIIINGQ